MNANTSSDNFDTSDSFAGFSRGIKLFALFLGLLFLMEGTAARAQSVRFALTEPVFATAPAAVAYINIEELSRPTLLSQSKSWWKEVRKEHTRVLKSTDRDAKARALQNIIYFRTYCPEKANFDRSAMTVYGIFLDSQDKQIRIMALAALSAIGNDDVMAYLGQHVRLESDPHIQRLTLAALHDFYNEEK